MKEFSNLLLFAVLLFFIFIVFQYFHYQKSYNPMLLEGMTDMSGNSLAISTPENGIAGNAASYAAALKANTIQLQDTFLISKYRKDYESAILNLDDLFSNLMLNTVLTTTHSNIKDKIQDLATMQQAKTALNSVMKFVDSQ
jgi:hypothetical protein